MHLEPDEQERPPAKRCAVCAAEAPWEVWETRMCDGCVSAWNTDPRFRKATSPDEYRALTATWLAEQRKARKAA